MRVPCLVAALLSVGCGLADTPDPSPFVVVPDSQGFAFSHGPREAALGLALPTAEAVLTWERAADGDRFVSIVDADVLSGGIVAGLDRMDSRVVLFDGEGSVLTKLGGPGDGPGELRRPLAVTTDGGDVLVWELRPNRPFTLFAIDGSVREASGSAFQSDFVGIQHRRPRLFYENPVKWSWEDPALRVDLSPDGLYFLDYRDEFMAWRAGESVDVSDPGGFIVRIRRDLATADTLGSATSGPVAEEKLGAGVMSFAHRPPFVPRTVIAAGDGWWAKSDGASSRVEIHRIGEPNPISIHWVQAASLDYSEDLQDELVDWYLKIGIGVFEPGGLGRVRAATAKLMRRARKWYKEEYFRFGPTIPSLQAMFGSGHCLWLAGFDTSTNPYGVALTLIWTDVNDPARSGVLRIPGAAERLRAIGHGVIVTTMFDENGNSILRRYSYDQSRCGT